jgi:glycosyltransferase involved in cell wall biosynthesis
MAGFASMKRFHVLGVTPLNDSYPNVKYKLAALARLVGGGYTECVVSASSSEDAATNASSLSSGTTGFIWRMLLGHFKVLIYSLRHKAEAVYVCYPGIFVTVCLGLPFFRSRYLHLYLDAFISLYDTVVHDREILKASSVLAKILFALEKRAFTVATCVIVDTPENAQYYSELFQLPVEKFVPVPLSIPPLVPSKTPVDGQPAARLRCVFVGTLVPLQGVGTIVEAISLLGQDSGIDFVFVGDGQDAEYLQNHIEVSNADNVFWHRGHFSTEFVSQQITLADLCLGVFGEGPKTQRVLPYKIYYYLALAKPVLTAATGVTDRIGKQCQQLDEHEPFAVVPAGDPRALADALLRLRDDPARFASLGEAGGSYYRRALSESVIEQSLQEMFEVAGNS